MQSFVMKMKALVAFKTKLFKPCRKLLKIFKFKLRKPVFIRALRPRSNWHNKPRSKHRFAAFLSGFRQLMQSGKRDSRHRLAADQLSSVNSDRMQQLFPSPLTPAYLSSKRDVLPLGHEGVEDACRSFENYLVEMIVEEGKVGDLTDVEELLFCWKNLKSPVFIDLVCRFYGELCKDLFCPEDMS